jgi:Tfp pilus assembly protein PilF
MKFALNTRLQALILAVFAMMLYAQTLHFDYVLDDGEMVVRQPMVLQGVRGIPQILSSATTFTGAFSSNSPEQRQTSAQTLGKQRSAYRPLSLITFAIEYQIAENSAVVRHATNVMIYAVVVVIVFLVFCHFSATIHPLLSFFAALIFAAHPLHTEVVCNIKSRDELLALLCAASALWFALEYAETQTFKSLVGSGMFFFLSLLAKENAITMLPIIPFGVWLQMRFRGKTVDWQRIGIICCVVVVLATVWLGISFRLASWGTDDSNFTSILNNPYAKAASDEILPTKLSVLGEYILKLVYPHTMSFDYGYRVIEPMSWGWKPAAAVVLVMALVAHGVWYIRSQKREDALPAFCLLWMLVAMSIASNLVLYSGSAMADRFMFLPSLSWSLALASGIIWFLKKFRVKTWEPVFIGLCGSIVCVYTVRSLIRIPAWNSPYDLTQAAVNDTPRSIKAHAAMTLEAFLKANTTNDSTEKVSYLHQVYNSASALTSLAPAYGRGFYTLALYFERYAPHEDTPSQDSARMYYVEAIEHEPENREYKHDWAMFRGHRAVALAVATASKGDSAQFDSALAHYREALTYNASSNLALANIGSVFARRQRYAEALPYLQKAVALHPYDKTINARLALCSAQEAIERGNAELRANRLESALTAYQEALRFGAVGDIAWLNIALVKERQGKRSEFVAALEEALRINPANQFAKRMLMQQK